MISQKITKLGILKKKITQDNQYYTVASKHFGITCGMQSYSKGLCNNYLEGGGGLKSAK